MDISITRAIFRHIKIVFGGIAAFCISILSLGGGDMVKYSCTAGSSIFYIDLSVIQGMPYCSLTIYIGLVLFPSLAITLFLVIGCFILDAFKFILKTLKSKFFSLVRYIRETVWDAKFLFTHIKFQEFDGKLGIYIIVHNDERWLDSKAVNANMSNSIYRDRQITGRIKWDKAPDESGEISIPRKSHKLLHLATVNAKDNSFTLHKVNGDETFPQGEHSYKIPLNVQGKIVIWKWAVPKVILNVGLEIVIDYKGDDNITVAVEKDY